MVGFLSSSSSPSMTDVLKVAIPLGVGVASLAYLGFKLNTSNGSSPFSKDKSIPVVALRAGDLTHDAEYQEDRLKFLAKCEKLYGPVFNLKVNNQNLTCVSGTHVKEIYMNESMSYADAMDELIGMRAFVRSVTKSNNAPDSFTPHFVIKTAIVPHMDFLTKGLVERMETVLDRDLGYCENKAVDSPNIILSEMIATAMANVFMGPKAVNNRAVLDSLLLSAYDFGVMLSHQHNKSLWFAFTNKINHEVLNPLQKHRNVLASFATPLMEERRQEEAEALRQGKVYERPCDILQAMVDSAPELGYVDMEDICGHLLMLVLASVHTTVGSSTHVLYYLAAHPECIDELYQEQVEVLDELEKEQKQNRERKLTSGEISPSDIHPFKGTDLDPEDDRKISNKAIRKMVKLDSFIREVLRCELPELMATHLARKNVTLSNGMTITKGSRAIINVPSVHYSEEVQGEDPKEFRPWRFVGKGKGAVKAGSDFLVFGLGKHVCPGRFLAIQDLKIIGALLVAKHSRIEIQEKEKTQMMLRSQLGATPPSPIIFTSRAGAGGKAGSAAAHV